MAIYVGYVALAHKISFINEMKGRRSEPQGAGEVDVTSEPVNMGHKSASGPIDGMSKVRGATLGDIDNLSDLRQVHWCTGSGLLPHWLHPGGATA